MELTPEQRALQETNRSLRTKAIERSGASEAEVAAWGLKSGAAEFFSILAAYCGSDEAATPIDIDGVREEWARVGDNVDELMMVLRTHDLVDEQPDGQFMVTTLGRQALQFLF